MSALKQNARDADPRGSWRALLRNWILVCGVAFSFLLYGYSAYRSHADGDPWLAALALPPGKYLFQIVGDVVIPVLVTLVWMQNVRRLPPSREKTVMTRLGWSFYIYLFVWWSSLHMRLFGP